MSEEPNKVERPPLAGVALGGFKSFIQRQSVEFRKLTILAGANSSGKSTLMQALLLLKQSLEVGYDPGVLLLDGPNVRFSSADQVFSRLARKKRTNLFEIGLTFGRTLGIKLAFRRDASKVIDVASVEFGGQPPLKLCPGMTSEEILSQFPGRRGPLSSRQGDPRSSTTWPGTAFCSIWGFGSMGGIPASRPVFRRDRP